LEEIEEEEAPTEAPPKVAAPASTATEPVVRVPATVESKPVESI